MRTVQLDALLHPSKMKVTSIVTRYSSILPFFTLAFSSITCRPVIPRNVRLSEAPSHGMPVTLYDPNCRGAVAYRELARNFDRRMREHWHLDAIVDPPA